MVKNLPASVEDVRFNPWFDLWVRKILWSGKWQPFAVFLPEKFHGQRRLVGYSPQDSRESDMTATEHTVATNFLNCF